MVLKQQNPKNEKKLHEDAEAGAARRSGWWISGSPGRWQRTSNTHSAGTMFGAKDATVKFRIKLSSQMSLEHADAQEGTQTTAMSWPVFARYVALAHIYIYIFTYKIFGNVNFIT